MTSVLNVVRETLFFLLFCYAEIRYIRQIRFPSAGNFKLPEGKQVGGKIMASSL